MARGRAERYEGPVTGSPSRGGARPPRERRRLAADVRVLIGVGGLLGLLAVAVVIAVALIVSLEDDATGDVHDHALHAAALSEAALTVKAMANDQRGLLLSGDPEYREQIAQRTAELDAAFDEAAARAQGPAQERAVADLRGLYSRWRASLDRDTATYVAGDREAAVASALGPTRQLRKRFEERVAIAYADGTAAIEAGTEELSSSAGRSVTMLFIYLAAALAIGVGVAVWVTRTVLGPAFALSRNAMDVLLQGRLMVEDDGQGSHRGVAVEVPIDVVNKLADSAMETHERMRPGADPIA